MSTSHPAASTPSANKAAAQPPPREQPLLEDRSSHGEVTKLDIGAGGEASVSLDHLGPMVVHQDGTLSRIANWGDMTEVERRNTLRVLGKRNQLRLESLRGKPGEKSSGGDSGNLAIEVEETLQH